MNTVILSGRLVKDVELKYTRNGTAVSGITIAVERRFKNKQTGEKEVDFIQCQLWNKTAELAADYLKKGSKIGVVGEWRTRNYEGQDGKRVYVNECVVNELEFLDTKSQGGENGQGNRDIPAGNSNGYSGHSNANDGNPFGGGSIDISDELPF